MPRRFFAVLAFLAALPTAALSQKTNNEAISKTLVDPGPVVVPEGTDIPVVLGQTISSKTAKTGDEVKMFVDQDVYAKNRIVIAKGTPVRGEIAEVKQAGFMGRGGKLTMKLIDTKTTDGQNVPIRATKSSSGGNNVTSTVALTALFGVFGLLRHGNDMVYKEGTKLSVHTNVETTVKPPER